MRKMLTLTRRQKLMPQMFNIIKRNVPPMRHQELHRQINKAVQILFKITIRIIRAHPKKTVIPQEPMPKMQVTTQLKIPRITLSGYANLAVHVLQRVKIIRHSLNEMCEKADCW
jgi:hypothetical protein